jgi:Tol biopolymer transport system component
VKHILRRTGSYFLVSTLIVTLILGMEFVPFTSAAFPGSNGKIAFTMYDGNDFEIFVMNPDGSDRTPLTDNDYDDSSPAWSADGMKIVFLSDRDGDIEIFVMNADGTNQIQLTFNDEYDYDPAWSPDGAKIVFRRSGALPGIYVMNSDGSGETRITTSSDDETPVWSPDGSKIAFSRWDTNDWDIWVMNPDGSGQDQITPEGDDANDQEPDWSPDSSRIVFRRWGGVESSGLFVINADGTGLTRLTSNSDNMPAWSPDGTKIVFDKGGEGSATLYLMNSDGTGQTQLTVIPPEFLADWQPLKLAPVGGVLIENNKNIILTPYLALAALVIAITVMLFMKKRD